VIAMFASIGRRTPEERWLLAEAVAALAVASFLIALVPFRRVALLARLPEAARTPRKSTVSFTSLARKK